jgi:DNA ligase 1
VQVYSRKSENNTGKYPDVVARIPGLLKPGVKSLVLDSEIVAWNKDTKRILPFQVHLDEVLQ